MQKSKLLEISKKFRNNSFTLNQVSELDWLIFFDSIQPHAYRNTKLYDCNECEELDKKIKLDEQNAVLYGPPSGKAAGTDKIQNKFLAHLPVTGKEWLLNIFNNVLDTERVPNKWAESTRAMLVKKGNTNDLANYRPVALLNHTVKIFTHVTHNRLYKWSTENGLLPEVQVGFRKGRGCEDYIFSLMAAIKLNLNKKEKECTHFLQACAYVCILIISLRKTLV